MLAIKSIEENMVLQTLVLSVILVRSLRFISSTGTMFSILEEKNEKVPSHGLYNSNRVISWVVVQEKRPNNNSE